MDFTRVLAGPFCTMNLGDLGANIIKVESIEGGDETRAWGPPFVNGESAYYLCVNRNKRSISIDLKSTEGRKICERLILWADVVIHNFLPHSSEKLGLNYEHVVKLNPKVIYCSISGYGYSSDRPGYDYILQAIGGLMSITGETEGAPVKVGVAITDLFTGLYATVAIQAALAYRATTGEGQQIDMALYDAQIAMLANVASNVLVGGVDAPRLGNGHPNIVPYQLFHTLDGQIVITVGNDRQFRNFCEHMNLGQLWDHPHYRTNACRVQHREELCALLECHLAQFKIEEVIQRLKDAKVPCGPINSVSQSLNAIETAERNMIWTMRDDNIESFKIIGSPLKMMKTPPQVRYNPPIHGEHTCEVLLELGYTEEDIKNVLDKGDVASC